MPDLVALFADPRVARYVGDGDPLSVEMAELWVRNSRENLERFGFGTGAVVDRTDGVLIGWCGFGRPAPDEEEVIYGLAHAYWGIGMGGELLDALIDVWRVNRPNDGLRATVDRDNAISVRLLKSRKFELANTDWNGEAGTDLYIRPALGATNGMVL
ncbi:GNAT family N-acetyltransferase [Pelagibacterium sp.]|uniref:GNAT family N-acetyltransferase n=1 Tax=Pelagibacterium sp. TaxID=1967288 RepID=UPI003A9394F7